MVINLGVTNFCYLKMYDKRLVVTCIQVIEEAECCLHDAIMIVRRTFKNSTIVTNGGATYVSNLLNWNLLYNLILFYYGHHMGAFIIKGAKDCMYTHKILHPHDFEK
jgi:hypothetical protein